MSLTVLTVTRRPWNMAACCATIDGQRGAGPLHHLIIADGLDHLTPPASARHPDTIVHVPRGPHDRDGPARLGHLRNLAVQLAESETIVFLDDDNRWTPEHLASLLSTQRTTGAAFVHSARRLFEPDGRPYLRQEFPWARDPAERRRIWREYRRLGIVAPGSNVWRDRLPMPASCVDLGAWVLPRSFLLAHPFRTTFSRSDWEANVAEDHGLAEAILASRLPVVSTGQPTLHYWLGGYSNGFDRPASLQWEPEPTADVRRESVIRIPKRGRSVTAGKMSTR
ncbi:MAG: hypothetical protein KatS3mg060_3541 [Dehalococcoidia bacterium]|nr:MAG: hypothetical protein KatS3mg060_3541 [Dehalococcoidia bacterium]